MHRPGSAVNAGRTYARFFLLAGPSCSEASNMLQSVRTSSCEFLLSLLPRHLHSAAESVKLNYSKCTNLRSVDSTAHASACSCLSMLLPNQVCMTQIHNVQRLIVVMRTILPLLRSIEISMHTSLQHPIAVMRMLLPLLKGDHIDR
jgi:hypothetical protein